MRIYDLSCTIDEHLWQYEKPYFPYTSEHFANQKTNGYNASKHVLTSHTGTHIECGRHWDKHSKGVDQLMLAEVTGKAKVLHINCLSTTLHAIDTEELIASGADKLAPADICIIATGWDKYIREEKYITGSPYLTDEAATYLIERGIKLLAIDAPFIGDPQEQNNYAVANVMLPEHELIHNHIQYVVGLTGAWKLPDEVFFIAAPLKLKDAEGSPVRAMAIQF